MRNDFTDGESNTPYKKKAKKVVPKKADHRHEYEPVIISFHDIRHHINPSSPTGFDEGESYCPGSRCKICGRLEHDFPKGSECRERCHHSAFYLAIGNRCELMKEFPELDVVSVDDFWNLNVVLYGDVAKR